MKTRFLPTFFFSHSLISHVFHSTPYFLPFSTFSLSFFLSLPFFSFEISPELNHKSRYYPQSCTGPINILTKKKRKKFRYFFVNTFWSVLFFLDVFFNKIVFIFTDKHFCVGVAFTNDYDCVITW